MNVKLIIAVGFIALAPMAAHADGDLYLIDQTTSIGYDITT